MIRVGVHGAAGRMGATVCDAVRAAGDLELVAAVDRDDDPADLTAAGSEVVVDFSTATASRAAIPWLLGRGVHCVVGTTGLEPTDLDELRAASARGGANAVVAANFAISAVLMMRFAELAAPHFDTVEIVESHHDGKVDAPSGTALATADRIAAASGAWAADPTTAETLAGARGGVGPAGIRVHAVRMRGMVAHQEVVFGAAGQTLTIRQDSYSRESFMPGVVLACHRVARLGGVTIGLDAVLDA